jgi:hypothetical protein
LQAPTPRGGWCVVDPDVQAVVTTSAETNTHTRAVIRELKALLHSDDANVGICHDVRRGEAR